MIYKFRVILDSKDENVIREIEINDTQNFEDLHEGIYKSFGFDGSEMATFYMSDEDWDQGEEIVMMDMGIPNQYVMADTIIGDLAEDIGDRFIYVYDLMSLWTFFVELTEIKEKGNFRYYPQTVAAVGDMLTDAPLKDFSTDTALIPDVEEDEFNFGEELKGEFGDDDDFEEEEEIKEEEEF